MGVHLMECSGNPRSASFGMISAARWSGVPVEEVLRRLPDDSADKHALSSQDQKQILISGFDEFTSHSDNSLPGASWIFNLSQLISAGAFFATHMNGDKLNVDHGYPVRLLVPNWYGCTCIKWVNQIKIVGHFERSTAHMREFATRTQQIGVPELASDFLPASIDRAAMPIRIEKWRIQSTLVHRIIGISWGQNFSDENLAIRFLEKQAYTPVKEYEHIKDSSWSFWAFDWQPQEPGLYNIQLCVNKQSTQTRRLDQGYYNRSVLV
jgi:DMSO/TMAO reductase YedYZ molybdopterin-dependent catalytic subunit